MTAAAVQDGEAQRHAKGAIDRLLPVRRLMCYFPCPARPSLPFPSRPLTSSFCSLPILSRLCDIRQTFISSATTLGALLGGLCAGILSDWIGRKPVVGIADVIFIAGAIGQAVSHDVWSMVCVC